MDLAFSILLMIHLAALVVGGATNVAMPVIGRQMAGASPEVMTRLGPVALRLRVNAHVALAVLVATGAAMLWLRYDGNAVGLGPWFVAKMGFVILIVASLVAGLMLRPGAVSPRTMGMVTRIALVGIVVCSVMTFG